MQNDPRPSLLSVEPTPEFDDLQDAIEFAAGCLDVMRVICGSLIGSGLIAPDSFQVKLRRYAALWLGKGNAARARPVEIMVHALKQMQSELERFNREAPAVLVRPENDGDSN